MNYMLKHKSFWKAQKFFMKHKESRKIKKIIGKLKRTFQYVNEPKGIFYKIQTISESGDTKIRTG